MRIFWIGLSFIFAVGLIYRSARAVQEHPNSTVIVRGQICHYIDDKYITSDVPCSVKATLSWRFLTGDGVLKLADGRSFDIPNENILAYTTSSEKPAQKEIGGEQDASEASGVVDQGEDVPQKKESSKHKHH